MGGLYRYEKECKFHVSVKDNSHALLGFISTHIVIRLSNLTRKLDTMHTFISLSFIFIKMKYGWFRCSVLTRI